METEILKELCRQKGIYMNYLPFIQYDGMADPGKKVIAIAEDIRGTEKEPEILAHEIAHVFLHRFRPDPEKSIKEGEADGAARIAIEAIRMLNKAEPERRNVISVQLADLVFSLRDCFTQQEQAKAAERQKAGANLGETFPEGK